MSSYKELILWQKSINLTTEIYTLTSSFPNNELFGLISQMRRASVSIASNVAEGSQRSTKKDFCHFLKISLGSAVELETQIEIAKRLPFEGDLNYTKVDELLDEIIKMIHGLIKSLNS